MRHTATPNDRTAQQPVYQEIDLSETEIDLAGLGEALAESIQHSRAASVTTESSEEGSDSDETAAVPTRRNTMASTSNPNRDTKRKDVPPLPNLTPEQIQQIIGALTGGAGNTKKPKIKEPRTFHGERDQLRGWLARLSVYFKGVGWEIDYNNDKIVYTLILLRGDALKWATPYIERRQDVTWSSWDDFKNQLQ